MRRCAPLFLLLVAIACTKGQSDPPATSASTAVSPASSASPTPSASSGPASCDGLPKTPCVLRPGCILDQPATGGFVCRAAKDDCERAVLHAGIIGVDVAGVTAADATAARAKCAATPGCVVAGGKCACTCHVFGNCDCGCGGGWLPRCVPSTDAHTLDGFPTKPTR